MTLYGSTRGKGMVLDSAVRTMEDLKERLKLAFEVAAVEAVLAVRSDGSAVEVVDLDFVRDDESLIVHTNREEPEVQGKVGGVTPAKVNESLNDSDFVQLNVGGKTFLASRSTLTLRAPQGMLAR